jgi:hypothetical protein
MAKEPGQMDTLHKKWTLGFKDRGLGHGDYAVVTVKNALVVECPNKEIAEHIIEIHNAYLEGISHNA